MVGNDSILKGKTPTKVSATELDSDNKRDNKI
jgi:hypothetical protein